MLAVMPLAKVSVMKAVSGTPCWNTVQPDVDTCTTGSSSQYMRIERSCGARSQTTPSRWYLPRFMRGRGHEVDVADDALGQQRADRVDRGAVDEGVARHQHQVLALGDHDELLRVGRGGGQRLLDEDVLAGLQRALDERVVGRRRRRDDDRVDTRVVEDVVELLAHGHAREALVEGDAALRCHARTGPAGSARGSRRRCARGSAPSSRSRLRPRPTGRCRRRGRTGASACCPALRHPIRSTSKPPPGDASRRPRSGRGSEDPSTGCAARRTRRQNEPSPRTCAHCAR